MLATYSPENKIENGLRTLQCSGRNFVEIAKESGVKINTATFSDALSGKKAFQRATADRLVDLLDQMQRLQDNLGVVPVSWSNTERVSTALTLRRVASVAAETGDTSFDEFAAKATRSVGK